MAAGRGLFAVLCGLAAGLAGPGAPLGVLAGGLFGTVTGVVSVLAGATLGAALCFLLARYLLRDLVVQKLSGNPKFKQLEAMTEKYGTGIVAITRLVPLFPFNLLNYGFGLTNIRFGQYLLWSAVCMLPGTVLYVAGSDAVLSFIRDGDLNIPAVAAVAGSFIILCCLGAFLRGRMRRRDKNG